MLVCVCKCVCVGGRVEWWISELSGGGICNECVCVYVCAITGLYI